jgi:hypothetical protein
VLAALSERLKAPDADWKRELLKAISDWPVAGEGEGDSRRDYLIGGEAFDWKLLAERIAAAVSEALPMRSFDDWVAAPDPAGGFEEAEFTRLLGVEKYRSHLNFVYGVLVEKALLAAVEQEITKRRVASGQPPTERARAEAYERLYERPQEALWAEFKSGDAAADRGRHGPRQDQLSLGDVDAFTYWLFKRRLKRSVPARIASDTRKGLNQFERMREAHERMLRERLSGGAIEQGGVTGTGGNARPSTARRTAKAVGRRRGTESDA